MKDFNFFEHFSQKNRKRNKKAAYISAAVFFILGIMIGIYCINIYRTNKLEKGIAEMQVNINSKELTSAYAEKAKLEEKLKILNEYYKSVSEINDRVKKQDYINTGLIKQISGLVPQSITFQTMNIADKLITMKGTAEDRVSIGEMEHNLKQVGIFEDIHVSIISGSGAQSTGSTILGNPTTVITGETASFDFNLTFKFKEEN